MLKVIGICVVVAGGLLIGSLLGTRGKGQQGADLLEVSRGTHFPVLADRQRMSHGKVLGQREYLVLLILLMLIF